MRMRKLRSITKPGSSLHICVVEGVLRDFYTRFYRFGRPAEDKSAYFHPNDKILRFILQKRIDCTAVLWYTNKARNRNNDSISGCGAVGSALPWGGRGRWFKSSHSDQEKARESVLFWDNDLLRRV